MLTAFVMKGAGLVQGAGLKWVQLETQLGLQSEAGDFISTGLKQWPVCSRDVCWCAPESWNLVPVSHRLSLPCPMGMLGKGTIERVRSWELSVQYSCRWTAPRRNNVPNIATTQHMHYWNVLQCSHLTKVWHYMIHVGYLYISHMEEVEADLYFIISIYYNITWCDNNYNTS